MTTVYCDMCAQPIHRRAPRSQFHVPMKENDADPDDQCFHPGIGVRGLYYKKFDVCIGCTRGLLRLKPEDVRALDEGERLAMEQI